MKRLTYALILILSFAGRLWAGPEDAVVRIPSHGCSATVIYTEAGRTYLLGCAHMWLPMRGRDMKAKPLTIDLPYHQPECNSSAAKRIIAVDADLDLSLIELSTGPLPYCCPVMARANRPGRRLLSVGFDEMRWPPQRRPTTILRDDGKITWTREPPWHGRSGGALIDLDAGELVGVVSAYVDPSRGPGIYVSHVAMCGFLERNGWKCGGGPAVEERREADPFRQPPTYPAAPRFQQMPGRPACPT